MRIITYLLLFAITISCNNNIEFTKKKTPKFSIEIASNLDETTILNEEATLQFKNEFQELYLIILEDNKDDLMFYDGLNSENPKTRVKAYANLILDNLEDAITFQNYTGFKEQKINGFEAVNVSFNGEDTESGENIFYYITIVDGPTHIYQIFSWTLFDKKEQHLQTIKKMSESFKPFANNLKLKKAVN